MAHKRKGQLTVSGEWAQHLRPWHRREFWKAERQAQKQFANEAIGEMSATAAPTQQHALLAIFTTTSTHAHAVQMARVLVERKLAACAQISQIESVYPWNGELHHEQEFRLMLKTTLHQYRAVERAIRELHTYELPAIFAVNVPEAYGPYAAWVNDLAAG